MLKPNNLRCEYLVNPLGIDMVQPRLSWQLASEKRAQSQSAYRILVADSLEQLADQQGNLWDSGRVDSAETTHVVYDGTPLTSEQRCYWQVHVWDQADRRSGNSQPAWWQMGSLERSDWQADWISHDTGPAEEAAMKPAAYLRREFMLQGTLQRATLYATARGVYQLYLNGQRVGDQELAPGWTDYHRRIQYQAYQVSELLRPGENAIGAILGDGWYHGYLGFHGARAAYGDQPQFLAQLHLEYQGGQVDRLFTDAHWQAADGPIRYSDLYMGECFDARQEMAGWHQPGFAASLWQPVQVTARDETPLVATRDQPVRCTQEIRPQTISQPAPGKYVVDLGQNMVGWVRLQVSGEAGHQVKLRFAEVLEPNGHIHTANLRSARATDTYILKGEGVELFEPHFTFHGFRYVEVSGYPGEPGTDAITGRVLHSDLPHTGHFECSHPMLNQLWRNILWGQRGNFLSVPTDCPQRDERLGWLGDAQIFVRAACFNMDAAAFFGKWMEDVVDAQSAEGGFPDVAPRLVDLADGAPAWGDAGIIIPWTLYQMYGDIGIIESHYAAMRRWMVYIHQANPHLLRTKRLNNNFGDWVALDGRTSKELLATAYWAHNARLMAEMAAVTGRAAEAAAYRELLSGIKEAFNTAYVYDDGRVEGGSQTSYLLALYMELLPGELRPAAAGHLVAEIERRGFHLTTGFVGTPCLWPVLVDTGHLEVAYRLLLNETYPSWGYMIKHGATTMWERWNGWTENEGLHDPGMNSFNHYAYGAIGEWLFRTIAGIDTDTNQSGFRHIHIYPRPGGGLTYARAEYESIHGPIHAAWRLADGAFHLDVTIPANCSATITLPTTDAPAVLEGGRPANEAAGVTFLDTQGDVSRFHTGSGHYQFSLPYASKPDDSRNDDQA